MQVILTAAQMRTLEQNYMRATATPSAELMRRAAQEAADAMDELGLVRGKRMAFLCGKGGNGGDGLAAAAICHAKGAQCCVVLAHPASEYTGDAAQYLHALPKAIPVIPFDSVNDTEVWVDALFGIGLCRDIEGEFARWIAAVNASGATIVSLDIPSGIHADTGRLLGEAVRADYTITFQHAKSGHYLNRGIDFTGTLVIRSIGIPPEDDFGALLCPDTRDIAALLPPRPRFSHKGTYGHLLIIAGSRGMAGAAAICARAALHSGAGLVSIACTEEIVPILQTLSPEAMCIPLAQNASGALSADCLPALQYALTGKSCIAVGPGLSRNAAPQIVRAVLESGVPAVIDADALNIIAAHPDLKPLLRAHHLITPHPGEAARLITPSGSEIADASTLHGMGCQVIYKGAASIVCTDDGAHLSPTGSPCMAKGGSGDMLTGIAAALMAQGMTAAHAAVAVSHIHGRAGEIAEAVYGMYYPAAMDIIACLPQVWKELGR